MFDWSKGSVLKAMCQAAVPHASYDPWLKGFANAWLHAILHFQQGAKVLDVGCSKTPHFVEDLRTRYGIEAHGLDSSKPTQHEGREGWGFGVESQSKFPHVIFHDGLAGEGVGTSEHFDAVVSVSTLEHIYDTVQPTDTTNLFPHYDALNDMARMVKPGGILAFTYDFPLCYYYNPGWSPLADFNYLSSLGLQPCCRNKPPKSETYIYNYADTLFVQPDGILNFCDYYFRIAILCFAFQKPGSGGLVHYRPHSTIAHILENDQQEYPSLTFNSKTVQQTPSSDLLRVLLSRAAAKLRTT